MKSIKVNIVLLVSLLSCSVVGLAEETSVYGYLTGVKFDRRSECKIFVKEALITLGDSVINAKYTKFEELTAGAVLIIDGNRLVASCSSNNEVISFFGTGNSPDIMLFIDGVTISAAKKLKKLGISVQLEGLHILTPGKNGGYFIMPFSP